MKLYRIICSVLMVLAVAAGYYFSTNDPSAPSADTSPTMNSGTSYKLD